MDGSGLTVLTQAAWHTEAADRLTAEQTRAAAAREGLELVPADTACGFKNVKRQGCRFQSQVCEDGTTRNLGSFATAEEAALAYARHIGKKRAALAYAYYIGKKRAAAANIPGDKAKTIAANIPGGKAKTIACCDARCDGRAQIRGGSGEGRYRYECNTCKMMWSQERDLRNGEKPRVSYTTNGYMKRGSYKCGKCGLNKANNCVCKLARYAAHLAQAELPQPHAVRLTHNGKYVVGGPPASAAESSSVRAKKKNDAAADAASDASSLDEHDDATDALERIREVAKRICVAF